MNYARMELLLVRGGWSKGFNFAGAVSGAVEGVAVDTSQWQVIQTRLPRKIVRRHTITQLSLGPTLLSPAPPGLVWISKGTSVRGPQGLIGKLSRLWVSRADTSITHVLVRTRGNDEYIIPLHHVETMNNSSVLLKIDSHAVRQLFVYRHDDTLQSEVRLAVDGTLADPRARRNVKVQVTDGEVMLAGEVDTFEQVRQSEWAARAVRGVRMVTNDVVVQEALAYAVEERIATEIGLASEVSDIRVLSEHGIVHLEGSVPSARVRLDVERAALSAAGVKVVVNHLRVAGEPPDRNPGTGPLVRNR